MHCVAETTFFLFPVAIIIIFAPLISSLPDAAWLGCFVKRPLCSADQAGIVSANSTDIN